MERTTMTLVKICGVRDPATALEAVKAGADMVGLMFAESKRRVTPQECHDVCEAIRGIERRPDGPALFEGPEPGEVRGSSWFNAWAEAIDTAAWRWRPLIVGVFADMDAGEVNDIASAAGLDVVQLSGAESADFIRRIERPVIRAIHVREQMTDEEIYDEAAELRTAAALMLDTASAAARGGTGEAFDWDIAAAAAQRLPFLLAGGLTPANVAEAVARVQPWGVDVSSGVETDGKKDIEKIRAFIRAAKGAPVER
jgi:phosphoribosylanthranilate isomerase